MAEDRCAYSFGLRISSFGTSGLRVTRVQYLAVYPVAGLRHELEDA